MSRRFTADGCVRRQIGGRGGSALAAVAMALLLPAASASARRPATRHETAAIEHAVRTSSATRYARCYRVRKVFISTAGPWARATLVPCDPRHGDRALVVLQLHHGRWRLRDLGTADVGCTVAPARVRRDLKLVCSSS